MADSGITVQTPSGNVTVATDEFPGGTHHERTKVQFGATGSATDVSSAAPLPVSDAALATALASLLTELGQKLEASDIAGLATASKQDAAKTVLDTIAGKDFATSAKQDSLLTELSQKLEPADLASLATAAKQDTLKTAVDAVTTKLTSDPATQTTLAAVLAKITSDPATGTAQTTAAGKLDAIKTSTDAVTTKLTPDPSTATKQDAVKASVDTLHTDNGGPGSSQPTLTNGGSGILGYLRNVLDALRGTLTVGGSVAVSSLPTVTPVATTPGQLRKTVTTAGTAVALNGSTLRVRRGILCALSTNTGVVVVGGSGVIAAVGTRNSPYLNAGDTIELGSVDLNATFIDSTVNGEGVTVYYEA